jgi:hypothetical protein
MKNLIRAESYWHLGKTKEAKRYLKDAESVLAQVSDQPINNFLAETLEQLRGAIM